MECDLYFGSQGRVLAVLEWVEVVEAELVGWCGPALVPCPASTPHPHTVPDPQSRISITRGILTRQQLRRCGMTGLHYL